MTRMVLVFGFSAHSDTIQSGGTLASDRVFPHCEGQRQIRRCPFCYAWYTRHMKRLLLLPLLALFCSVSHADTLASLCNQTAIVSNDIAVGPTQIIAAPPPSTLWVNSPPTATSRNLAGVHICSVDLAVTSGATAVSYGLVTGTGTNCAIGTANLTPQWFGVASQKDRWNSYLAENTYLVAPAGKAVCLNLSAVPTNAQALVVYGVW